MHSENYKNDDIFRTPAIHDARPRRRSHDPNAGHRGPRHPRRHPAPGGQHSLFRQIQWDTQGMSPVIQGVCFSSHQLVDAGQRWRDVMEQLSPAGLDLLLDGQVPHHGDSRHVNAINPRFVSACPPDSPIRSRSTWLVALMKEEKLELSGLAKGEKINKRGPHPVLHCIVSWCLAFSIFPEQSRMLSSNRILVYNLTPRIKFSFLIQNLKNFINFDDSLAKLFWLFCINSYARNIVECRKIRLNMGIVAVSCYSGYITGNISRCTIPTQPAYLIMPTLLQE